MLRWPTREREIFGGSFLFDNFFDPSRYFFGTTAREEKVPNLNLQRIPSVGKYVRSKIWFATAPHFSSLHNTPANKFFFSLFRTLASSQFPTLCFLWRRLQHLQYDCSLLRSNTGCWYFSKVINYVVWISLVNRVVITETFFFIFFCFRRRRSLSCRVRRRKKR